MAELFGRITLHLPFKVRMCLINIPSFILLIWAVDVKHYLIIRVIKCENTHGLCYFPVCLLWLYGGRVGKMTYNCKRTLICFYINLHMWSVRTSQMVSDETSIHVYFHTVVCHSLGIVSHAVLSGPAWDWCSFVVHHAHKIKNHPNLLFAHAVN